MDILGFSIIVAVCISLCCLSIIFFVIDKIKNGNIKPATQKLIIISLLICIWGFIACSNFINTKKTYDCLQQQSEYLFANKETEKEAVKAFNAKMERIYAWTNGPFAFLLGYDNSYNFGHVPTIGAPKGPGIVYKSN